MILPTTSPKSSGSSRSGAAASICGGIIFLSAVCFFAVSPSRSSPGPEATEVSLEEKGSRRLDASEPASSSKETATLPNYSGSAGVVLPCSDESTRCAEWTAKGECGRNSIFMHKQCAASCGTCEQLADNGGAQPVVTDGQAERCRNWAASGECRRNPRYMREKCQDACPKNLYDEP